MRIQVSHIYPEGNQVVDCLINFGVDNVGILVLCVQLQLLFMISLEKQMKNGTYRAYIKPKAHFISSFQPRKPISHFWSQQRKNGTLSSLCFEQEQPAQVSKS